MLRQLEEQRELNPDQEWSEEDIREVARQIIEQKQKRFSDLEEPRAKQVRVSTGSQLSPSHHFKR